MVIIERENNRKKVNIYIDGKLFESIQSKWLPGIYKKDNDRVILVDGPERSGKSTFAFQLAKILDKNFNLDRICMSAAEFREAILKSKKGECVVFDEAFTGLSSRASLSEINRMLVELMQEMGQKNLFVIIVMPTFFLLDKYVALFRSRGLFHVYLKRGQRGRWAYFNYEKKKLLYLLGKKMYSYREPRSSARGRFYEGYVVDEAEYRKKKNVTLLRKSRTTRAEKFKEERDIAIRILYEELEITQTALSSLLKERGFKIEQNTLSEIINENKEQTIDKSPPLI